MGNNVESSKGNASKIEEWCVGGSCLLGVVQSAFRRTICCCKALLRLRGRGSYGLV